MNWLLDISEQYRSQLRQGPFFRRVGGATLPNDLQWVHQLIHQSREFTQALCLRSSLCQDRRYQPVFAEHAMEEADHPDQLVAWMSEHGFLHDAEPGEVPPTIETLNAISYCWRSAMRDPHDVQVVTLNLLSEGVALDFYSAVIPVLDRLRILSGRYWKTHTEIDAYHLSMGLDICGAIAKDSERGELYQRVLWQSATLYHQMLSSWVGERVQPLPQLA